MEKIRRFLLFLLGRKREKENPDYRPSVSVLIPAYNEEKTIGDTLQSIKKQTYPIKEIIVVDDSSTDKTGEIARSFGAKVVRTPKNTGTKSRAQNFGLSFVESEVVVSVDADTILEPRAIELIIPHLAENNTLCACGFVLPQKIETFWERGRFIEYLYFCGLPKKAQAHFGVPLVSSGCFSAFKTKLLREMGGFGEGIAEDMDLTWKAHLQGKKVKFVPEAVCYVKDPENWRQYKAQMMRWDRGFLQCIQKYKLKLMKNPRLFFFVSWYLISGILYPFFWAFLVWYLIFFLRNFRTFPWLLFGFFGAIVEILIVFFTIVINAKTQKCLRLAIVNFPFYWLISPIDTYLFLNAIIKEWVLRERLEKWEKGH